jgi:hypothetical protein
VMFCVMFICVTVAFIIIARSDAVKPGDEQPRCLACGACLIAVHDDALPLDEDGRMAVPPGTRWACQYCNTYYGRVVEHEKAVNAGFDEI